MSNFANGRQRDAFVGIDVAFAKRKTLPISVCAAGSEGGLEILPLRSAFRKPPVGKGNLAALEPGTRRQYAVAVLDWMTELEQVANIRIRRIALDAPSCCCADSLPRRVCESALDALGIHCLATPTKAAFENKVKRARQFIADGGAESRLPNANQFWMLIGFELFETLRRQYECIETYPHAIVRVLGAASRHKSTADGLTSQIASAAELIGLKPAEMRSKLAAMGYGSKHDRLDAFLSAWVASLDEDKRQAIGSPPDDVIWTPLARAGCPEQGKLTNGGDQPLARDS